MPDARACSIHRACVWTCGAVDGPRASGAVAQGHPQGHPLGLCHPPWTESQSRVSHASDSITRSALTVGLAVVGRRTLVCWAKKLNEATLQKVTAQLLNRPWRAYLAVLQLALHWRQHAQKYIIQAGTVATYVAARQPHTARREQLIGGVARPQQAARRRGRPEQRGEEQTLLRAHAVLRYSHVGLNK